MKKHSLYPKYLTSKTSSTILIILGYLFTNSSHAALIDNVNFTTDTATGLDWLDVTESIGLSYNFVTSQMGAGGQFDGWSYASTIQIQFFVSNAGGTIPMSGWSSANDGVVAPLLNLWGTTQPFAESRLINGTFILGNPSVTILSDDPNQSQHLTQDFISLNETTIVPSGSSPIYGSALVRSSSSVVPLPASVWLFISALVGLAGKKRLSNQ